MDQVEIYRRKAEAAEREAHRAVTELDRAAYERIAHGWRELEQAAFRRLKRGV
jgi:hypothetical protein